MKLSEFDYQLPRELIAQFPLKNRDSSRLLVLNRKSRQISHRHFSDILDYINALGEKMRNGINLALERNGIKGTATGIGSLAMTHLNAKNAVNRRTRSSAQPRLSYRALVGPRTATVQPHRRAKVRSHEVASPH